ncbi:hypothetical protein VKT23_016255 [Stygiomarasmius scandens]|uniref:Uncharacterized protein n=1 Tax=Marasmiellus scandens TaxID=2682957 RepID=A0ABR1IYP9_9AGAR
MSIHHRCSLQRQFDAFVLVTPVLDTLVSDTLILDTPALVPFHDNLFANPLLPPYLPRSWFIFAPELL